jgi:L-asparaginase
MKTVNLKISTTLATFLLLLNFFVFAQTKQLPNVTILATGGTIAGAAATGTQAGYTSGQVTIDAMINAVPGITKLALLKGEQISNVGSQDMSFEIMMKLARRINELSASKAVSGIVITHGTDTMAETARFLASRVTNKTVVITGAMIPYKFGSSDGLFNLGSGLAFVQTLPPGVYVAMNGRVFHWDNVRKNKKSGEFEELQP